MRGGEKGAENRSLKLEAMDGVYVSVYLFCMVCKTIYAILNYEVEFSTVIRKKHDGRLVVRKAKKTSRGSRPLPSPTHLLVIPQPPPTTTTTTIDDRLLLRPWRKQGGVERGIGGVGMTGTKKPEKPTEPGSDGGLLLQGHIRFTSWSEPIIV